MHLQLRTVAALEAILTIYFSTAFWIDLHTPANGVAHVVAYNLATSWQSCLAYAVVLILLVFGLLFSLLLGEVVQKTLISTYYKNKVTGKILCTCRLRLIKTFKFNETESRRISFGLYRTDILFVFLSQEKA